MITIYLTPPATSYTEPSVLDCPTIGKPMHKNAARQFVKHYMRKNPQLFEPKFHCPFWMSSYSLVLLDERNQIYRKY